MDGGPIKIGYTENLDARLKQLEAHYDRQLAVLAIIESGPDEERTWHERFAHLRLGRTEQFQPAPELLGAIGRPLMVGANPSTVEAMNGRYPDPQIRELGRHDHAFLGMARMVATAKGLSVAEYLSEAARPVIERDFAREMKRLEGGVKE